jgi:protein-L-isoaspartate O-methyltransferase
MCGFTAALAQLARRVYAIDIDTQMLDRTKVLLVQTRANNCDFIQADAMDVATVALAAVDYVFLANTFHGVPDK